MSKRLVIAQHQKYNESLTKLMIDFGLDHVDGHSLLILPSMHRRTSSKLHVLVLLFQFTASILLLLLFSPSLILHFPHFSSTFIIRT